MASKNPTFELGILNDFWDLKNESEMVAETWDALRDQQSESPPSEKNHKFIQAGFGENTWR